MKEIESLSDPVGQKSRQIDSQDEEATKQLEKIVNKNNIKETLETIETKVTKPNDNMETGEKNSTPEEINNEETIENKRKKLLLLKQKLAEDMQSMEDAR